MTAAEASAKPKATSGFAALVAAGIFLSRIAGLVREKVFAHYFGNSPAAGAFKAALRIPNLLQNLFGEGVLSASFIPVYSRLLAEGDEKMAGRVAGAIASLLALVVGVLVLVGVIFTPFLIDLIAPGFKGELYVLTVQLVRILFPATGLLVMSAWCLGILNSHHKFFLSYVAPVLWSGAMIATLLIFGGRFDQSRLAIVLAWGTVVGSALQFGVQLPFVLKYGRQFSFALSTHLEPVKLVVRNTLPVFLGRGAVQLSAYIDVWIASLLGYAAVSALSYAQTLYLLPISLFGMSIAAAELPQMSGVVGEAEEVAKVLRQRLARALRQVSFFVVPSVVAFVLIGDSLVAALFQGGKFTPEDTRLVWYVIACSTVGIIAATQARSLNSAFYAMRDTGTPLRFALVRIVVTAALGLLLAFPLRPLIVQALGLLHLPVPRIPNANLVIGALGLTISSSVASTVEFLLLRGAIRRRIGDVRVERSYRLKLWGSAIIAAVFARLFAVTVGPVLSAHISVLPHIITGLIVAGLFGVLYFAAGVMIGVPEARSTLGRFIPAFRRK